MSEDDTISLFKTSAWARAKGALREVGEIAGQGRTGSRHKNWQEIEARVEAFIQTFEDDGLHE
jgi:hypothetical protein